MRWGSFLLGFHLVLVLWLGLHKLDSGEPSPAPPTPTVAPASSGTHSDRSVEVFDRLLRDMDIRDGSY